ncbi:MAG: DNA-binding protein [Acidimicrobiales bacterium]
MGLKDLKHRLTASAQELDRNRLKDRYSGLGLTKIAEAPLRQPVRIGGEIQGIQIAPRGGNPSLEVNVTDGSGKAVAVFTGRRRISGLDCGRGVLLEGVGRTENGRIVLVNPAYTLLD